MNLEVAGLMMVRCCLEGCGLEARLALGVSMLVALEAVRPVGRELSREVGTRLGALLVLSRFREPAGRLDQLRQLLALD